MPEIQTDTPNPEIPVNKGKSKKGLILISTAASLVFLVLVFGYLFLNSRTNSLNYDSTQTKSGSDLTKNSTASSQVIKKSTDSAKEAEKSKQFSNTVVSFAYPSSWKVMQRSSGGAPTDEALVSPEFAGDLASLKVTKGSLIRFSERNTEVFDKTKSFLEAVKAFYAPPNRATEKDIFVATSVGGKEAVRWDSYLGYKENQSTYPEVKSDFVKTFYFVNLGINTFTSNINTYSFARYYLPGEREKYEKEFLELIESVKFY